MLSNRLDQTEILKLIFENDPSLIFVKDDKGRFVAANKSMEIFFGESNNHILDLHEKDLLKKPEEFDKFIKVDLDVISSGKIKVFEEAATNALGEICYYRTTKIPMQTSKGESLVLGIAQDITSIKKMESQASRHEYILNVIFNDSPIPMSITNLKGYFTETNRAFQKLYGYSAKELAELTIIDLTHPSYRKETSDRLFKLRSSEIPVYHMTKKTVAKSGEVIPIKVTSYFSPPNEKDPEGFTHAIVIDLREHGTNEFL